MEPDDLCNHDCLFLSIYYDHFEETHPSCICLCSNLYPPSYHAYEVCKHLDGLDGILYHFVHFVRFEQENDLVVCVVTWGKDNKQ